MSGKLKVFTVEEVAKHNNENDLWIIVNNDVYDVTNFLKEHPGGKSVLVRVGGKDATLQFDSLHKPEVLQTYSPKLLIGTIKGTNETTTQVVSTVNDPYGNVEVPYAEPYWYFGTFKSPYYNESHAKLRQKCRDFIDKEILPHVSAWEEAGDYPKELHQIAYDYGVLGAPWPVEYGGTPVEGEFDIFHDFILIDELSRSTCGGVMAAVFTTLGIALPPILRFGSEYLKNLVAKDLITGKKIIALAITEPYVGSDVASIQTTARREGDFYIVNGEKKFISSGIKADYYTLAVRTGGPGMGGISLLLVEKNTPGITARRMKTQGWLSSNTAYISFDNVKVPVQNIIGKENHGFKAIMYNFNHERFMGVVGSNRMSRVCLEESIKYARVRKTFGKRLIDHQVAYHNYFKYYLFQNNIFLFKFDNIS